MARRPVLLAVLLLAPSLAAAQATAPAGQITVVESADPSEVNPPIINIDECKGTTPDKLTYHFSPSVAGPYSLYIADQQTTFSTPATCPPTSTSTTQVHSALIASNIPTGTTIYTADSNTVDAWFSSSNLNVSCTGSQGFVYFCMSAGSNTAIAATGTLQLDLALPPTPTGVNVTAGDTALHVSWSAVSGSANGYRVFWRQTGDTTFQSHDVTGAGTTGSDITGLTNGQQYDVQVAALSIGKNEGTHSDTATGTPVLIDDFWRLYQKDGGQEQGGCAGGAAGLAGLLALLPLALRRRRS